MSRNRPPRSNTANAIWVFAIASLVVIAALVTRNSLLVTMAAVFALGFGWTAIRLMWLDVDDARWEAQEAADELDDLEDENRRLQRVQADQSAEISTHTARLADLTATTEAAESARSDAESALAMTVSHAAGLESSLRETQHQLAAAQERVGELTAELGFAVQQAIYRGAPAAAEHESVAGPGPEVPLPEPRPTEELLPALEAGPVSEPVPISESVEVSEALPVLDPLPAFEPLPLEPVIASPLPPTITAAALSQPAPSAQQVTDPTTPAAPKHAAVASAFEVPDWDDPSWDTLDADPATILLSWEAHIRRTGFKVVG